MWWNDFWPAPWMLFGPMTMFLVMIICMAGMFFMMMRMGSMHRSTTGTGPSGVVFGFGPLGKGIGASHPANRPGAFEEYREEALRRLEQEQKEFEAFVSHLRSAKDKAEFDQFMAERRARASQT